MSNRPTAPSVFICPVCAAQELIPDCDAELPAVHPSICPPCLNRWSKLEQQGLNPPIVDECFLN